MTEKINEDPELFKTIKGPKATVTCCDFNPNMYSFLFSLIFS